MNTIHRIPRILSILALCLAALGLVQPAPASMVGQWISGPSSLADTSGYTPAGTHDGYAVTTNGSSLGWNASVPSGFSGNSLDFSAGAVGVLVSNTSRNMDGPGFVPTFENELTSRFTVTFWYRPTPSYTNNLQNMVSIGRDTGDQNWNIQLRYTDYSMRWRAPNNYGETNGGLGNLLWTTGYPLITNTVWQHCACVMDGTSPFRRIYINGVTLAAYGGTNPWGIVTAPIPHLGIGVAQRRDTNLYEFSEGGMYDVRIYNTPLTSNDVADVMNPLSTAKFEATMVSFGLPVYPATIDQNAKTISWTLPYTMAVTNLAPTFAMSYAAKCDKLSGSVQDFTTTQQYAVVSQNNQVTTTYFVTVFQAPPSSEKAILTFGPGGIITGTDIRWVAPPGSDITQLAPTYTMSFGAIGYPASGATNDFTTPRTYTVVAEDLSSNIYTVTAVVPAPGWTNTQWTSDADSGITTAYPYVVAVNVNGAAANVNGIDFQASALSGPKFLIGGGANPGSDPANNVTSTLAATFIWGASPRTVTLSSLTPGTRYKTTFFSVGWEAAGRTQTFNAGGGDVTVLDQDMYGNNNGITISYLFEADASGSKTFTITQVSLGTFHLYALAVASLGSWQGADMLSFGPGAVITGTNIAWTVPYGSDVTTLTPIFSLSEGATCDRNSGDATDFTSPVLYTVVSPDSSYTNVYTVTATVAPASSAKAILTFTLPGNPAVISGTAIALNVPYGTDRTTLAPIYTISPLATATPPSGTTLDFTTPQTYTVTAEDMSTLDYTVTVNVRSDGSDAQLTFTNGLIVWLKADAIDTNDPVQVRTSGSDLYVQQWNDLSGYGHVATNDVQNDQPQLIEGVLNGKPALRFAKIDQAVGSKMYMGDLSDHFPSGATMFVIGTISNDRRYTLFGNRANDERWVADSWTESTPGSFRTNRANFTSVYSAWPTNGSHIFSLESSASIYQMLLNGKALTNNAPQYHNGAGANWVLGNRVDIGNGAQFRGDIPEFLLYDRVLSSNEAGQVGGYLATKYGLATAYPNNGPFVDVVNALGTTNVPFGTTVFNVAGSNNALTVGTIWWTNITSGGEFLANSTGWSFNAALSPGMNLITVSGSNAAGAVHSTWTRVNVIPEPAMLCMVGVLGALALLRKRG